MAIASFKPSSETPMEINLPRVEPESYSSIVSDDKYTPLSSLIAYVEGSSWTVNYYSQVVTKHNDLREHDPSQENIYQQYSKVNGLELKVSQPLTSSQNEETASMTVSGSALIYPFLTPNVGDMFVASTGDNHDGMFVVKNVERKNFNRDSVFAVDYDLVCYVDASEGRYENLESKVIRTSFFHRERLAEGLSPTLIQSEHQEILDLHDWYSELCQFYFKTFFNREFSTLILPGQRASIYDTFLVQYLLKIVDSLDAEDIRNVKNLTTELEPYLAQPQFWTAMLERDVDILGHCNRVMGLVPMKAFGNDPFIKGLRYTRIQYIVYPTVADDTVFSDPNKPYLKTEAIETVVEVPTGLSAMSSMLHSQYITQNKTEPFINPVINGECYIFNSAFYNNSAASSVIEGLTLDYLKHKPFEVKSLHTLVKGYRNWGRLEQYYYIPIVLTLIKATLTR